MIATGLVSLNNFENELSAIIIAIHLIYVVIKRPYRMPIHNLAIIINQTTLFLTVMWLLFEKYCFLSYSAEKMLLYCLFGMIVAVLAIGLTRPIYAIW